MSARRNPSKPSTPRNRDKDRTRSRPETVADWARFLAEMDVAERKKQVDWEHKTRPLGSDDNGVIHRKGQRIPAPSLTCGVLPRYSGHIRKG